MRVIAGIHKGRQLKAVSGKATRPTADKVKEAVFQMIGPYFNGGRALDLFAGSGALAIEALSRGMHYAVLIDQQEKAIHTIYDNLKTLSLTDQTEVYRNDAFRALQALSKRAFTFDLILLDPPYKRVDYEKLLYEISKHQLLTENGFIVCEHESTEKLPEKLDNFCIYKHSKYGGVTRVTIYESTKEQKG